MTTKSRPAVMQVEDIKRDLEKPVSTTSRTRNLLRAVLGLDVQDDDRGKLASASTKPPIKQVKPLTKIGGAPRRPITKKHAQVTIREDKELLVSPLDTKSKRSLATEVFNTTLKTLSHAAKSRQEQSRASPKAKSKSSGPHVARPLEQCSPNRQAKPNEKKVQATDDAQLDNTVMCAATALQCLRQLETETNGDDAIDLRLEQGALVLLDKTITLDLVEQAEGQLRILHEQYWKRRKASGNNEVSRHADTAVLAPLLVEVEGDESAFRFATTLQSSWLRLAMLRGSAWVTKHAVQAMGPETAGGPSWTLIEGHRTGHLDKEACGMQLRTVSLALTKLYTSLLESPTSPSPDFACLFELGCVALRIKAHSWKYLGHGPDLQREFWTPVRRYMQRYKSAIRSSSVKPSLLGHVKALSETLVGLEFDGEVPSEVNKLMGTCIVHKTNQPDRLDKRMGDLTINEAPVDLLADLDAAACCLEAYAQESARVEPLLEQLRESIDACTVLSQGSMADLFLKIARVRKGLLNVSSAVEQSTADGTTSQDSLQLQIGCIRTLYCFVNLVLRCLQQPSSGNPARGKTPIKPSKRADLLLTYAKTVEAVVSTDQLPIARGAILSKEARVALHRVIEISELAQNEPTASAMPVTTRAFFESIPVRVSQAFWDRYLWLTEHRRPTHDCIETLQLSIDVVQRRSLRERQAAVMNLKYEKLAALLEETKSFSRAIEVLQKGIQLCLELGSLNDAVEEFLLGTFDGIWTNPRSSSFTLGKYLTSYVRVRLRYCGFGTKFVFDEENLPKINRFVLAERQITSVILNSSQIAKEQLKDAVQDAWNFLSQPEHRKYQLQFTSHMLFLLERSHRWNASDFFTCEAMRCLTDAVDDQAGARDSQLAPILRHTLSIQWALATGCLSENMMGSIVANLKGYFSLEAESQTTWNDSLNRRILSSQLLTLGDFAGVLGDERTQLEILMMFRMLDQHTPASDRNRQLASLIHIGILHNRLDNTNDAGKAFAQAGRLLAKGDNGHLEKTLWALGYAEYLLNITNTAKSAELLHQAYLGQPAVADGSKRTSHRLEKDAILCRAAHLASRIAFHQSQLCEAVSHAKQAVKLSTALWVSIEKKLQDEREENHDESSLQIMNDDLPNMTLSGDHVDRQDFILRGARYWSVINVHRQVLRHIAFLFSHLGLYQDSLYYLQQVSKVSLATAGRSLNSSSAAELALLHASAGDKDQARFLMSKVSPLASLDRLSRAQICDLLTAGEVCVLLGQHSDAGMHLKHLDDLQLHWLSSKVGTSASPSLHHKVTPKKQSSKVGTTKRAKQVIKPVVTDAPVKQTETPAPLLTASQSALAARAISLGNALHQFDQPANANRDVMLNIPTSPASLGPVATVSDALALLRHALACFSTDPASNALAETALGMPVRYKPTRKSGQMSLLLEESTMLTPRVTKAPRAPDIVEQGLNSHVSTLDAPRMLKAAFEMLQATDAIQCSLLPSSLVTVMYQALSQITLMSSAVDAPLKYSSTAVILQSLIPKEISRTRERHAIRAESTPMSLDQQRWPQLVAIKGDRSAETLHAGLIGLVQSLPQTWSVVSIGLGHDRKELLVSKIEAGASPFLMRVPLGRPDLEQNEPHEFTFEVAKAELVAIIREADASSHDDRGQGDKQARNSWYAEREALDRRLKALLVNIENIWLGGFRGLLASHSSDSALLSRFGQSLSQCLDKHLPSRQKASKNTAKVDLHTHVLELFTNLPFEDSPEFEDSITDLLYFTIDILQFNGEPNAYDEIDFDAMLVNVLEALRAYHTTYSSSPSSHTTRHTILVIDKELEAFPWESLFCLQGRPVSRMPSLGAIKHRLDLIRAQSPTADALSIPAGSGAYILNPSSDLISTQQTFADLFASQLPTFEGLINAPPTSAQFETYLTQHPLLLYFGHGSGAQYILKRKIRAFEKCAVTWLMGCSSAKMTEYGQFESVGMPNVYVHGGSAAVVGTLWDVTDRDLDRCALRALSLWGLADGPGEEDEGERGKSRGKGKGNGRKKEEVEGARGAVRERWDQWKGTRKEERRGKVALDEAVSAGREACRLRYLNGAAVVVYGVPVVLE